MTHLVASFPHNRKDAVTARNAERSGDWNGAPMSETNCADVDLACTRTVTAHGRAESNDTTTTTTTPTTDRHHTARCAVGNTATDRPTDGRTGGADGRGTTSTAGVDDVDRVFFVRETSSTSISNVVSTLKIELHRRRTGFAAKLFDIILNIIE